jgi:soluble lytic murein transglycosylase
MVDRASHMLRMIESDPEKAELAGRTTVEMAEKLHKWCDEHGLKGTFFADDEEKYKTSMYWDIAKYDGAVHGGLAITDANPEKKVYKSIADLKKAQFVKDGAMDVGHPDRLTEDELKEIVARCYFDASPLDKNTEAKLRQELSVARMKMWFEEEHEKEEYREEHGGSLDGFEYSFTKKLREADEMAKAEKEGVAILVKELDAANREKKEVSLEAPLVPGAIKRTRVELRKNATDTKRETAEHGRALLLVLETWVKKQYAKDQRELEFAELQRRWDGAGVEDWILEVKAAEEKKARAKFDGIKKRISEAEQRAKKNRTDAVSLQSIIDMAHGGSLTRDQYSKAIASLSREMKQDQWRGSPEFRSSGKDETERLVDFAKRVVLEVERAAKVEEDRAEELKNELTEFQSYDWAREKAAKAATGDHPEKDGAHPVTDKAEHPTEAGGHDDHAESKKHPAIEKLDNAGHGHGHEKEEKKLPEFETIPYEAIPDRPEPGADDPKVFFSGWEYSHRKVTRAFWKSDVVQSEYDKMKDEQKIRLANTLSMLRAEGSTTSAAYYETPDPYFKKGYKKEKTKRSGKEDKPKEEKITGVLEPRPYGLKVPELAKIYDSLVKPGENGEKQKAIFWTQIPSSNVPGREGERQLFLISLHTADNKLGKGQPVKFYLDVKKDVAQRVNALLTHDANNAIHIVRGLSKAYGYERFADVPFEQGQTMHAQVQWSGPKKKLEVAPPLPPKPKPGEPVSHSRRNFLAVVGLAGGAYVAGRVGRPHVARVWRKRKTRSEDENNLEGDLQNVREYREGDAKFAPHYTAEQLEASLDRISAGELESLYGQKIEDPKTFLRARLQQIFNRSAIPMASGALSIGEKSEVSGVKYFEQFKKDKPKIIAAVLEASKRHGVPADVIFGVLVKESRGYRGAVSNRGAKGLMQVIDGTATKDLGWTQSDWEKNWQQIRPNIDTGAKYLKILDRQFGGRKDLVFAAYNGGPTGVLNMIERYAKDVLHKENIFDKDRSKRNIVNARALKFIEDNHINMLLIYEYYRVKRGMKENDLPETMAYVFAVDALTVGAPAKWMGEEIKQAEKNKQQEASSSPDSGVSSVDGGNNNVEKPEEDRLIIEENPDEEVPTIDLTSTSTSVESDSILDIEDTRTTNTSTQTDARLSRRDLLRGRKSEKAAEAPKGLSSDGQWAKGLVSGLDKFSDEKMSRSEKDKLMAEISSAEAKFDAFKKDKKIRSKEDYKALVEAAESLKAKMQWADFKLNIGYVGRGNIREIDKKITFFKEKAK